MNGLLLDVRACAGWKPCNTPLGLPFPFHRHLALPVRDADKAARRSRTSASFLARRCASAMGMGIQFLGFIAGIAEHHALVARTDVVALAAAALFQRVVDAHGDIGELLIPTRSHRAGRASNSHAPSSASRCARWYRGQSGCNHLRLGGDFAHPAPCRWWRWFHTPRAPWDPAQDARPESASEIWSQTLSG